MPYIVTPDGVKAINTGFDENHPTLNYPKHDLNSVYTHYDTKTGRNVSTENKLPGGIDTSGKGSK